jgi:glycosyltransferase involved in cell wall biosynthesis
MPKIPFLLLGDGPSEPTGLGRIARDLARLIVTSDLPLDLVQVGGQVPPVWMGGWAHVGLERGEDWGASSVQAIYRSIWGEQPGVLMAVWDPSRLYAYTQIDLPVQKWCYTAIDGANANDQISGPARVAVEQFDRVLAYGRYGAGVLKRTLGRPVQWLPHGIEPAVYRETTEEQRTWAQAKLGPHAIGKIVIGCVMTNQFRKDFGLLFESLAQLKHRGYPIYLWLHTDELVKAWSVQQLVEDFGLQRLVTVTGNAGALSDQELSALYHACTITALPSLGEGFGYPIVESLACGVPVVHTQWGGGEGYVPKVEWKVPVRERRLDSVYAIARPVMRPEDWANAMERAIKWRQEEDPNLLRGYLQGSVAHLAWSKLWPRWYAWLKQGLV